MARKHIGREQIVETAARLIDENNGTKDVTLREIAKKLGCAHTNLYNYFGSQEEIYWAVLTEIIRRILDFISLSDDAALSPDEILSLKLSRFIDFYADHPGWYRLAWLEPLNGAPPPEAQRAIGRPMRDFANTLMLASPRPLSLREALEICDIIFMYVFGELGIWINRRSVEANRAMMKEKTLSNARRLFLLLTRQ